MRTKHFLTRGVSLLIFCQILNYLSVKIAYSRKHHIVLSVSCNFDFLTVIMDGLFVVGWFCAMVTIILMNEWGGTTCQCHFFCRWHQSFKCRSKSRRLHRAGSTLATLQHTLSELKESTFSYTFCRTFSRFCLEIMRKLKHTKTIQVWQSWNILYWFRNVVWVKLS